MKPTLAILIAAAAAQASPALMPMPAVMTAAAGRLTIDAGFRIAITGITDARLEPAARRLRTRIFREFGFSPLAAPDPHPALTVECRQAGPANPTLGEDESYTLDVSPAGAHLRAATVTGALRGLQTFAQLIAPSAAGFYAPAVHIEDRPRFPWRGFMLDVSRHWMPLEVVERNLDGMAAVKLNVFHWHLSDDQGVRVESKLFPRFQERASDGKYYTQAQIREVIAYARDRGIRVVPEFDIPGHTTAWFAAYPELASAPGPYSIERHWGIFKPTIDPSREQTYEFLDRFLGEMAALFPDPYFHIGGDEVDDTQWKQSPAIQAFARAHDLPDSHALQHYFNRRVQQVLNAHGKIMIGWDEVLAPGLASDTIIQSWRGQDSLAEAARKGYRGILSSGYYLDHLKPAAFSYAIDPLSGAKLDAAETARILGGEACMWTEYVTSETVDSRIWPRLAAIAERFWSPRGITDPASMYSRMERVSRGLEWAGVRHRANYGSMLDRLAGSGATEPLRILADAVEAVGIDVRQAARKYSSLVDLNRLVDAARPESESVRHLQLAAARLSPADLETLRTAFLLWSENDARFEPLAGTNSLLLELKPLSKNLSAAGAVGLEALRYLETPNSLPEGWISQQKQALDRMQEPTAEVSLAAVRPVRMLLDAIETKSVRSRNEHGRTPRQPL